MQSGWRGHTATRVSVNCSAVVFCTLALFVWMPASSAQTPDLVPANLVISPNPVQAGQTLGFSFTVRNAGLGAATITTTTRVRLSASSSAPSPSDPLLASLATPPLAAGASVPLNGSGTVPSSLSAGTYYVWVIADQHHHVLAPEAADEPGARQRQPGIRSGWDAGLGGAALVGLLFQEVLGRPNAQVGVVGDLQRAAAGALGQAPGRWPGCAKRYAGTGTACGSSASPPRTSRDTSP